MNQGSTFVFFVITEDKLAGKEFILKLTQNQDLIKDSKLESVAILTAIKKENIETKFQFFKNVGPNALVMEKTDGITGKCYLWRLILHIISLIFGRNRDRAKYVAIERSGRNKWKHSFAKGATKVSVEIPFLFMGRNEAAGFEIEVINEDTGKSIGGLTVIVKR